MSLSVFILPVIFIFLLVFARFKGVKLYDAFAEGARGAIPLAISIFPYLVAIFIMTELFSASGLSAWLQKILSPVWNILGIPKELGELILIKPFSGSGSLAVLSDVYTKYGVDSYISRCASVIFGSSETVFYVSAVYFANCKTKRLALPIIISLVASLISSIFACLICKFM